MRLMNGVQCKSKSFIFVACWGHTASKIEATPYLSFISFYTIVLGQIIATASRHIKIHGLDDLSFNLLGWDGDSMTFPISRCLDNWLGKGRRLRYLP